jgi:4-hydroxybenzoate polyprenyltransferase
VRLRRLWQPGRLLFWQFVFFNAMSSACALGLQLLPLNAVGLLVIAFVGLMNAGFGLWAGWMLVREPPPRRR